MEKLGTVPEGTAAACREGAKPMLPEAFPLDRINELDRTLKHDLIAFLTGVGEVIGEPARHLHKGMTSSDVLDTTLAVQLKQSGELILETLDTVLDVMERRSREHAHTLCMGRRTVSTQSRPHSASSWPSSGTSSVAVRFASRGPSTRSLWVRSQGRSGRCTSSPPSRLMCATPWADARTRLQPGCSAGPARALLPLLGAPSDHC